MRRIELTIFSAGFLQMLQQCGIKPEDEKHIPLYKDYAKMLADGEKRAQGGLSVDGPTAA